MADDDDSALGPAREQREDEDEERSGTSGVRGRPFTIGNAYRFKPGVSGNPSGRAKGIGDLIDKIITEEIDTKGELGKREALELMVRTVVRTALKGGTAGTSAFRELMDRRYGRVPLSVRLGPEDDGDVPTALRIRIVDRDDVEREAKLAPVKVLPPGSGNGNGDGTA